jgi:hypothetical protein
MSTGFAFRPHLLVCIAMLGAATFCRAESAIHWKNSASQDVISVLGSNGVFTTDFKGSNDAHVSKLSGTASDIFFEAFGGSTPGNNPLWITNFIGNTPQQTGNGVAGHWGMLEPSSSAGSFQFDFSVPFGPGDRMMIADVDQSEKYQIAAYRLVGGSYQAVPLAGWTHFAYSGETGITPDSRWATWNPADGTLTSSGSGLSEPLDVFAPDQNIDRVVFVNFGGGGGTPAVQFAANISQISLPGDYNLNGRVDAPDFALWRNMLGQFGINLMADGDHSNSVDSADYNVWRSNFGQTGAGGTGAVAGANVPEPAGGALSLAICTTGLFRRRTGD